MQKVRQYDFPKINNSEIQQWQNDIKNSIKSFYLQKKEDDELIDKYEKSFQTFKEQYTIVFNKRDQFKNERDEFKKENEQLKNQIKQFQTQENQFHQKQFYQNQFSRKRPLSRFDYENNDDEDVQYIVRKKRNTPRIIYEDEDEREDEKEMNIDQKKDYEEVKKLTKKKGISKSIKV